MTVDKNVLTITIDLSKKGELSGSGKSFTVATTSGNVSVPEHKDIKIGINAFVKNPDYKDPAKKA
jgi:hypothetical protein